MRGAVIDVIVDNLRKTFIPAFFGSAVVLIVSIFLNVSPSFYCRNITLLTILTEKEARCERRHRNSRRLDENISSRLDCYYICKCRD